MEAYYRLPEGREDCTQLYLAATKACDGPAYQANAASLPIVGTSNGVPPSPPGQPWADLEAVEAFLNKSQAPLDQLHEAARRGGGARYPTDFNAGVGMLLTHVQNLRSAARML